LITLLSIAALVSADLTTVTVKSRNWFSSTKSITVNSRVINPVSSIGKPDVLFFIGFADCVLNHEALFQELTLAGHKVITFDYPGHGSSPGSINDVSIMQLGEIGVELYKLYGTDANLPVQLVGWSTGGLVAIRVIQEELVKVDSGVVYAPGVKVQMLVGSGGLVTASTLTNNPSANKCEIKPKTPLTSPLFAANLLSNAASSWKTSIKSRLLVFAAGDTEDHYVVTSGIKDWIKDQCSEQGSGCKVIGVQCLHAKHELDNEPDPVGSYVRKVTVQFLEGRNSGAWGDACRFL